MAKKVAKKKTVKTKKSPVRKKAAAKQEAKKGVAAKKTIKKAASPAGTKNRLAQEKKLVGGVYLGRVEDYFSHVCVMALTLKAPLGAGDIIRIKGHTTDLMQKVESMQIEHAAVEKAKAGDAVGIKIAERCRKGDRVYKI